MESPITKISKTIDSLLPNVGSVQDVMPFEDDSFLGLPMRGTGRLTGRAGPRNTGRPRTTAQRLARHNRR